MADQFYLERDQKKYGPFSAAHLKKLAAAGRLQPTDLVSKEGMETGVPAANVKKLFPDAQAAASAKVVSAPAIELAAPQVYAAVGDSGPSPAPPDAPGTSPGLVADTIPDGLTLVPIPGQAEWQPAAAPAPARSPPPDGRNGPAGKPGPAPAGAAADRASRDRPSPKKQEPVRKRRAVAVSGAVLMNQDGERVYYRKKCSKCGHEDSTRSCMLIGSGITRVHFFCTKCRKMRDVQIQGLM
jgi:hypothetical protein